MAENESVLIRPSHILKLIYELAINNQKEPIAMVSFLYGSVNLIIAGHFHFFIEFCVSYETSCTFLFITLF